MAPHTHIRGVDFYYELFISVCVSLERGCSKSSLSLVKAEWASGDQTKGTLVDLRWVRGAAT